MKILAADDSALARAMVKDALTGAGYEVVLCENGEHALEELRRGQIRIAVLDWLMPKLTGLDVCRHTASADFPVWVYSILLTGKTGENDLVEALDAGASDFVRKPVSQHELVARVNAAARIVDMEQQLVQAQKLESIGQMAAGIAHEINSPLQFVNDNARFIRDGLSDLTRTLSTLEGLLTAARSHPPLAEIVARADEATDWKEVHYLAEELPAAVAQSLEGIARVSNITAAMKDFASPEHATATPLDVNQAISATLTLLQTQFDECADKHVDFDAASPRIQASRSELTQVMMALTTNAMEAIRRGISLGRIPRGEIRFSTKIIGDSVRIEVGDNGGGIPPEIQDRVFNPFFTTKQPGDGTGQGLSTVHSTVTKRLKGSISFQSAPGVGTVFSLSVPRLETDETAAQPEEETGCTK